MEFGKATFSPIQLAKAGSDKAARPTTAFFVTLPLCGMLSQDMTVKGCSPLSRRAFSPATMRPNTVFGEAGFLPSSAMAGCCGLKEPEASMK
ncbi:hypothetical protein D3C80_1727790 [compost metagenome]